MVKFELDTSRFDPAFREYIRASKRSLTEIVYKTAYFVARNCVNRTRFAAKDKIRASVWKASKISSSASVGNIVVNKIRGGKGQKGLYGKKMTTATNKLGNVQARGSNHLRAGWMWAIKNLESKVRNKAGAPRLQTVKAAGQVKGGANGSNVGTPDWFAFSSIWNSVQGGFKKWKDAPARKIREVQSTLTQGAQLALDQEEISKRAYIEKELNKNAEKFNR